MIEIKRLIEESITDEEKDIEKYSEMSSLAESLGMNHIAGVLYDIKHDEKTHKELLKTIVQSMPQD